MKNKNEKQKQKQNEKQKTKTKNKNKNKNVPQNTSKSKKSNSSSTNSEIPETVKLTLETFQENQSIKETAVKRGLVASTIESHLIKAVEMGLIEMSTFLDDASIKEILDARSNLEEKLSEIKAKLNDKYTFFELKLAYLSL